ncbi:AraC family transcriptional regulator [Vibrio sp. Of7-15]|uniref:helix-turn-helix domain-containing protein n=1 Tax=Vibrio sp. Of7-15 TaxID=2724879 RepID=UPI001EF233CA|nr:AraC family transcriptional regulator [Vibrio sp. Of7-15]MCG7497365.1 AraC family transcriptional regulator [Vibrio sp. Of7-15]
MAYVKSNVQSAFKMCEGFEGGGENRLADYATTKVELDENMCLGHGYIVELAPGLNITYSDVTFHHPTSFKEAAQDYFGACLAIEGEVEVLVSGKSESIIIDKDKALFFVCHQGELEFRYGTSRTKFINFCVPKSMMQLLFEDGSDELSEINRFESVQVTSDIVKNVEEILRSKLGKAANTLYLQGKVLELLALIYHNMHREVNVCCGMTPRDMDCIQLAARIMEERMDSPPSLIELSRQIGINDNKLKKNFKMVFGETVYGFLSNKRMAKAGELLAVGDLSVQEVANIVGFKHVGHFSKKFKEQYMCSPKHYRRKSVHVG